MALRTELEENINDEWSKFISQNNNNSDDDDNFPDYKNVNSDSSVKTTKNLCSNIIFEGQAPQASKIYISTKSKIAYLTKPIDLKIFWDIPIIAYATPNNGVIKKQIKLNSKCPEELLIVQEKLKCELYCDEQIMSHIDNPSGRIKFKDIRKITIGISKKDIMTYRSKRKQAFYNCFVMIIRLKFGLDFKEFHIKVFNTGKLEIPGVQSEEMFETVLKTIVEILQPYNEEIVTYKQTSDTVLINSNFNCGFYINREILYDILKYKYNIQAIYDPCSYPGIQCKYYYKYDSDKNIIGVNNICNNDKKSKKNSKCIVDGEEKIMDVSFMIFRTGSILIVGMCNEDVLDNVYNFLTNILNQEFQYICQKLIENNHIIVDKKKKIRKKIINILPITIY